MFCFAMCNQRTGLISNPMIASDGFLDDFNLDVLICDLSERFIQHWDP